MVGAAGCTAGRELKGRKGKAGKGTFTITDIDQSPQQTGRATGWTSDPSGGYNHISPSKRRKLMAASKRRCSKAEFARRGDALVDSKVRPTLTPTDEDKFVAIDIETGE
jgi:hypothetical protein